MIVLSAVASTVDRVVSCASAVAPSKITAFEAFIVTEFTIVCVPVTLMFVTFNVPVLGLYVKSPSDSSPKLPPSTSPPAVKTIALFSSVDSLSVTVTRLELIAFVASVASATAIFAEPSNEVPPIVLAVASVVAVSALPVTSPVISPTNAVDVMLVAPVTTPASTTIVPSRTICCPANGVIVKSVPAVLVIALPLILILSTWSAVNVPTEVIAVCAAPVTVAAVPDALPVTLPVIAPANASAVTVPSKKASLNSKEAVPKSISLSVTGAKAPSINLFGLRHQL